MKVGVITDCFKQSLEKAIHLAGSLGLDGVQIYATTKEFSPRALSNEKKEFYKKLLKENKLVISALCADMGGHGFEIEEDNPIRIQKTKEIIDLANEFGAKVITTHIGVIPSDKTNPRYQAMLKALAECGLYAKEKDVTVAIETGPEKAAILLQFLLDTKGGVGVNLDPANFVMVTDQDPSEAVYLLKDYIVHTHLKDGKMLKKTDPKIIYDVFAGEGIEGLNVANYFIETPVGAGDVDFEKYLKALNDIGYDGFLTIEREVGDAPLNDIKQAINFIKPLI